MEFYRCCLFVTFVVLTFDQFVGRDDGPLQQQKQDSHVVFHVTTPTNSVAPSFCI